MTEQKIQVSTIKHYYTNAPKTVIEEFRSLYPDKKYHSKILPYGIDFDFSSLNLKINESILVIIYKKETNEFLILLNSYKRKA